MDLCRRKVLSLTPELELKHIRFTIQLEEDNGESSSRNQVIQQNVIKITSIFNELEQYQHNESYNKFYFTRHHKKEQLSHEKLEQLVKSLELSIEQPWASDDKWMDFIIQVLKILKKYIIYLREVNQKMNTIHNSDVSIEASNSFIPNMENSRIFYLKKIF
ncbi:hypothetical protein RirG_195110 [Rhizophagus irregularis DAOM 197198w]|uniref:Uncharacterized protein n=1 Tax=Rhizophagus irregularis (strain DAOM 197198w) TaxID=1432141 RepID=A0A015KGL0_RHIIW|nr:hypothetical protein RirG_195110 [Rhizophagus irregularis DAOM 197198w]